MGLRTWGSIYIYIYTHMQRAHTVQGLGCGRLEFRVKGLGCLALRSGGSNFGFGWGEKLRV